MGMHPGLARPPSRPQFPPFPCGVVLDRLHEPRILSFARAPALEPCNGPSESGAGGAGTAGPGRGVWCGAFFVDGANFVCVIQPASGVAAEKGPPRPCLQASSAVGEFRWLRRARVSSLERFFKHAGSFWLRCVLRKMSVGHVCVCPRVWRGWHSGCARELKGLLPPHFPPNNSHAAWTTGTWCLVG